MSIAMPEKRLTKKAQKALKHRGFKRKLQEPAALPEEDLLADDEEPQLKKRRVEGVADVTDNPGPDTPEGASTKRRKSKSQGPRFICFVGKLSYATTSDKLADHFATKCEERPQVRLLTKKGATSGQDESKGAAFVEFKTSAALQQALSLHRSSLGGRKINVELTAGGGGKGEARQAKLARAKARLEAQRADKPAKEAAQPAAADAGEDAKEKESKGKNAKRKARHEGDRRPRTKDMEKRPVKPRLSGANAMRLG